MKLRREPAEVDEEAGRDGRQDAEVEDAGEDIQKAGQHADTLRVADLQQLVKGQRARLAIPVGDHAQQRQEKEDETG